MKKVKQHFIIMLSMVAFLGLSLNTNDLLSQNTFFAHEEIEETIDIEEERHSTEKQNYKLKVSDGGVGIIPDLPSFNPLSPYVYLKVYSLWTLTHKSLVPKYILHCCLKVDC